jgi:hypothetical protein
VHILVLRIYSTTLNILLQLLLSTSTLISSREHLNPSLIRSVGAFVCPYEYDNYVIHDRTACTTCSDAEKETDLFHMLSMLLQNLCLYQAWTGSLVA